MGPPRSDEEAQERAAGGRAGGRASERSACTDLVRPARATAASAFAPTQRRSARSPAVSSLTFPPSTTAERPFFRPSVHAAPSCFPLPPSLPSSVRYPRPSKICRSFNSSFVVRQPRVRLQQCNGAPLTSLLAATKVRSLSDPSCSCSFTITTQTHIPATPLHSSTHAAVRRT